jgi:hypothetical protein
LEKKIRNAPYRNIIFALATAFCLIGPGISFAQETLAVLSSEAIPYREALEGFREALGRPISTARMTEGAPKITPEIRVVVAFGGKAAQESYPDRVSLIYCLAPGTKLEVRNRQGSVIEVKMLPRAGAILSKLKEVQPGLKRLAVFSSSKTPEEDLQEMREAAPSSGIEVFSEKLNNAEELPGRLRAVFGKADGILLLPDPLLINANSLSIFKEFSWSSRIPFYVPTAGLVEHGAVASVSSTFREIGHAAGSAARRVLEGGAANKTVYPEKVDLVLNMKAAASVGLQISNEVVQKAEKVLR